MFEKKEFSKNNTLALKGIAILMMVFHHCFRNEDLFENYNISFFPFSKKIVTTMCTDFKICVSIFVFITGYGLTLSLIKMNKKYDWSNKEICKWIVNRLIKLMSGFWIIAIFAYIICQIIDGRTATIFFQDGFLVGIIKILIDFFGLTNLFDLNKFNPEWWYMTIAILFVFTIPIFLKLFKKYGYLPIVFAVICIPRILGWKYVNSSYISFLFPLLLGIICAENNLIVKVSNFKIIENIYLNKILKFLIETIIICILVVLYNQLEQTKFWEIRYGIIPVLVISYFYEFLLDLPLIKNILMFLGKHSMNIFLIHSFLRNYYLNEFIYSFNNWLLVVGILVALSLVLSIFIELIKKLIKYNNMIESFKNYLDKRLDVSLYNDENEKKFAKVLTKK